MSEKHILVFEDKLGITDGYQHAWASLLQRAKLATTSIRRINLHRSELRSKPVLVRKGNRKQPGFNADLLPEVTHWFEEHLHRFTPAACLIMDPALFGLVEIDWKSATTDNLRGGVYDYETSRGYKVKIVITTPMSAVNRRMDPKEIAMLNQGAYSKSEWQELQDHRESLDAAAAAEAEANGEVNDKDDHDRDESAFFLPPYKIPYGRFVLSVDLNRLRRVLNGVSKPQPKFEYTLVDNELVADHAKKILSKCSLVASDVETNPLFRGKGTLPMAHLTCVGYSGLTEHGEAQSFLFPIMRGKSAHSGLHDVAEYGIRTMADINANAKLRFTFQNGAYDLSYLARDGMPVHNYAYDSMTMFWSFWPELPKRLEFITSILSDRYQYWKGGIKSDNIYEYWYYCGEDCYTTLCNTLTLAEMLSQNERARRNFFYAHARVGIGWSMSMRGIAANEDTLIGPGGHKEKLDQLTAEAEVKLKYLVADDSFNVNSPKQKKHLLYTLLGARPRNAKGRYVKRIDEASTGAVVLRALRNEHPIFRRIIAAMQAVQEPSKQLSNVVGIKRRPMPAGRSRMFTSYDGVGTTTTRFSSRQSPFYDGGNVQNLRGTYRDWLEADDDSVLLDIDFSAADDVYVSFESGDQKKIELFRTGLDSHAMNATMFFDNWNYEDVIKGKDEKDPRVVHPIRGIRQITKKLCHGCNYLMAAMTLLMTAGRDAIVAAAKELGNENAGAWTQDELVDFCVHMEEKYRAHYDRFKRHGGWYDDITKELTADGGVTTCFWYYQRFLGDPRSDDVLRAAAATFGQASTAGRINDAIMEMDMGFIRPTFRDGPNPDADDEPQTIGRAEYGISLRLQTHDSLTFNVNYRHPRWLAGCERIIHCMSRPSLIRNKSTGTLETFVVRIESEVGKAWGKKMLGWDNSIETLEEVVIRATS